MGFALLGWTGIFYKLSVESYCVPHVSRAVGLFCKQLGTCIRCCLGSINHSRQWRENRLACITASTEYSNRKKSSDVQENNRCASVYSLEEVIMVLLHVEVFWEVDSHKLLWVKPWPNGWRSGLGA